MTSFSPTLRKKILAKKLKTEEASQIAQAFLGLAHMDKEFGRGTKLQPEHG